MKYTKENIVGIEFAESNKTNNLYKCLRIQNNEVIMSYLTDVNGYTFSNTLETTLKNMNNGNWKDFTCSEHLLNNLQIW